MKRRGVYCDFLNNFACEIMIWNMKRILLTSIVLCLAFVAKAATNTYQKALTRYVQSNRTACIVPVDDLRKGLTQLTDQRLTNRRGFTTEELVDVYIRQQFMPDMVEYVLLPTYGRHCTEQELKELTQMYKTTKGKFYLAHLMQTQHRLDAVVEELLKWQAEEMDKGSRLDPIALDPNLTEDYVERFNAYYDLARLDDALQHIKESEDYLWGEEEYRKIIDLMLPYLKDNLRNITLNLAHQFLTTDDLKFGIKLCSSEAYQRSVEAHTEAVGSMQSATRLIYMKYLDWLTK